MIPTARALEISFPLEGHYREGKFMPMHVSTGAGDSKDLIFTIHDDGALATEIRSGGGLDAIVPWLAARGTLSNPRWTGSDGTSGPVSSPLVPLGPNERLLAYTGQRDAAARLAADLFPGQAIVPVALDLTGPLLTPAVAYEVLDAIVLDAPTAQRVTESQLAVLLAGGVAVAVQSDARPAGDWPWKRQGAYWVLRHDIAGPQGTIEPDAYALTGTWLSGWPAPVRWRAMLIAAVFALAALALTLWRSRYLIIALLATCAAATAGIAAWGSQLAPIVSAGGSIFVRTAGFTQIDAWTDLAALRPAEASAPFLDLTHPVFDSPSQFRNADVRLICAADGRPTRFTMTLLRDHRIIFLSRIVQPEGPAIAATKPVTSPLLPLADQLYPGQVVGQVPPIPAAIPEAWNGVVLQRPPPAGGTRGFLR